MGCNESRGVVFSVLLSWLRDGDVECLLQATIRWTEYSGMNSAPENTDERKLNVAFYSFKCQFDERV